MRDEKTGQYFKVFWMPEDEMAYGWIITKDVLSDKEEWNDVNTIGPNTCPESLVTRLQAGEGQKFRLFDGDGELYYEGLYLGPDGETMFGPLNDFGTPNAGAVTIAYWNETKQDYDII